MKETEVLATGFNKNNYESKRIWAAAADGTSLMIMNLLLVKKMVIKSNKKNLIAKDLFTKKYKPKVVKPKKGKGSFKRKKS